MISVDLRIIAPPTPERANLLQRAHFHLITQQLLETLLIIHTAPCYNDHVLASIRGHMTTAFRIAASYRLDEPTTNRHANPFPALLEATNFIHEVTRHAAFADPISAVGRIFIHTAETLSAVNPTEFTAWKSRNGV